MKVFQIDTYQLTFINTIKLNNNLFHHIYELYFIFHLRNFFAIWHDVYIFITFFARQINELFAYIHA